MPHLYKVTKDSLELRRLALLHPRAQWEIAEFYRKYENVLLFHCSRSPVSLRAPAKIAGTYFRRNSWENIRQYRDDVVATAELDEIAKHSPSFFAYRGHDRLFKFFESRDYVTLEKSFPVLATLDVARCFDSIYTHSISWAVKDKEFTKEHVRVRSTFAQEFDGLMQAANHSETNGIVIGPEVSRIFAEIIFQEIDVRVIRGLAAKHLVLDRDFALRRYVDDVFIFAVSEETANRVYEYYADALGSFNLHPNRAKFSLKLRPFVTPKSRLIHAAGIGLNDFIDKFLVSSPNRVRLVPKEIRSKWRLTRSLVESIRMLCGDSAVPYDEVSSFAIAVLAERVKKLIALSDGELRAEDRGSYRDAILVLLDALFFLYQVAPSVTGSYKLSTALILLVRFSKCYDPRCSRLAIPRYLRAN